MYEKIRNVKFKSNCVISDIAKTEGAGFFTIFIAI